MLGSFHHQTVPLVPCNSSYRVQAKELSIRARGLEAGTQ
jgi:hypothetical protein